MKIAVLCFAFKLPKQINVLVNQFLSYNNKEDMIDFYLHIDKKNEHIKQNIETAKNFYYIKNNIEITWGDDSMVKAFINSINEIVETKENYDSIIICTGQDLIVREDVVDFLKENKEKIYLDMHNYNDYHDDLYRKSLSTFFPKFMCKYIKNRHNPVRMIRSLYCRLLNHNLSIKKKINYDLKSVKFYYSFCWSVLPNYVVDYLYKFFKDNKEFLKLYEKTLLPEDGFLGTIIMNSKFKDNVVFENEKMSKQLTYMKKLDNQHAPIITMNDIEDIDNSKRFFARKFDMNIDEKVVSYYENKIINRGI